MTEPAPDVVMTDAADLATADEVTTAVDEFQHQFSVPTTGAIQKLMAESQALDIAFRMARSLSQTTAVPRRYQQSFVPKGEREPQGIKAAHNLAAAILYGAELGMTALQSAQNVFDVHGQPAVYARTMVAQVRKWIDTRVAQGITTHDPETGDSIWEVSATADSVVWAGRRDGRVASAEWTLVRAEAAGFTKNEKYQQQPIEMLRAKAMTEICRILFQDVLLGMAYSIEDIQLSETVSVQVVRPAAGHRGASGLKAMLDARRDALDLIAPGAGQAAQTGIDLGVRHGAGDADEVPDAAVDSESPSEIPSEPTPTPITRRQLTDVKRLLATQQKLTVPSHPDALQYVGNLVSREISSLDELTSDEAKNIITELTPTKEN